MARKIADLAIFCIVGAAALTLLYYLYGAKDFWSWTDSILKGDFRVLTERFGIALFATSCLGIIYCLFMIRSDSNMVSKEEQAAAAAKIVHMEGNLERNFLFSTLRHTTFTHRGAQTEHIFPDIYFLMLRSKIAFEAALVFEGPAGASKNSDFKCVATLTPEKNGQEWQAMIAVELLKPGKEFVFLILSTDGGSGVIERHPEPQLTTVVSPKGLRWQARLKLWNRMRKLRRRVIATGINGSKAA